MTHPAPSEWYCDTCGDKIVDPTTSLVVWRLDDMGRGYDYRVVHKSIGGRECDPGNEAGFLHSLEISNFLGAEGVAHLLSYLSQGPILGGENSLRVGKMEQFVDLFRRMQTPYYEEARRHFACEEVTDQWSDANEVLPYVPESLNRIAKPGRGCDLDL